MTGRVPGLLVLLLLLGSSALGCGVSPDGAPDREVKGPPLPELYGKREYRIEVRDGTKLHTAVYTPRDTSRPYPILLRRTPYGCRPYGSDFPSSIGPSPTMEGERYIFVCQDVRGRWMSEGSFDNMRPHVPGDRAIDESSDTYDTIEWLLRHVPNHNGRVGMWGISYPGFYAAAALPEAHPALVASSPQAPIADFFFDDFHHHGAYFLSYWLITPVFGYQTSGPTRRAWYPIVRPRTRDGYQFYMDLGPLSNSRRYYTEENFFWRQLVEHPNYDEFWQRRNILPHLNGIDHAVMTVGGWFDAEDLYGPLNIYRTVERENPAAFNVLVMGPWSHGGWSRSRPRHLVGDIYFGGDISGRYQREVEAPFFRHFLKGEGSPPDFEALVFDTGVKKWREFDAWPPSAANPTRLYLRGGERLSTTSPGEPSRAEVPPPAGGPAFSGGAGTAGDPGLDAEFTEFVSDPNEPVPYTDDIRIVFTPRRYMTEDQRFATRRPDVIEFRTEVLAEEVTLAGDLLAHLEVSTTGSAADWIVKLIDVYPPDEPNHEHTPEGVELGGYEQMVRSEVIRGRFRNGYQGPVPFVPGEITTVRLPLQDVYHTFKRGHRIMVHVQSTWFPLVDRNPQRWVDNVFEAKAEDFTAQTHRVYHSASHASYVEVKILE